MLSDRRLCQATELFPQYSPLILLRHSRLLNPLVLQLDSCAFRCLSVQIIKRISQRCPTHLIMGHGRARTLARLTPSVVLTEYRSHCHSTVSVSTTIIPYHGIHGANTLQLVLWAVAEVLDALSCAQGRSGGLVLRLAFRRLVHATLDVFGGSMMGVGGDCGRVRLTCWRDQVLQAYKPGGRRIVSELQHCNWTCCTPTQPVARVGGMHPRRTSSRASSLRMPIFAPTLATALDEAPAT
jgi:hypothetical protein